ERTALSSGSRTRPQRSRTSCHGLSALPQLRHGRLTARTQFFLFVRRKVEFQRHYWEIPLKTILLDANMQQQLPKGGLAIDGGQCVRTRKFAPWPSLSEDEVEAASVVLRSGKLNYWTGEEVRQFENEFASFAGCQHAIAVANGTVALELALYSLRIGPGDEVIVPSRTFVASASCVIMRGAKPVFADVDPISRTLTASSIRQVLTPSSKAIIAVH